MCPCWFCGDFGPTTGVTSCAFALYFDAEWPVMPMKNEGNSAVWFFGFFSCLNLEIFAI